MWAMAQLPQLAFFTSVSFSLLSLLAPASAQVGGGTPGDREKMWWAPTAEDWQKPVLIDFQRSWEDAVQVAKETGKLILICVNMDGEIASEHYAGVRYRQPEIAKIYEPYVAVIASVYRHSPRDYDEKGQRVLCPRFGSVTCGEHIAIEPILHGKYFEGQRVAPRHIGIDLQGKETYDVYYAFDTDSVFQAVREGSAESRRDLAKSLRERPLLERASSPDILDRTEIEQAYLQGDVATRFKILKAALANPKSQQPDLLRLAIFGLDVELARLAREALAKATTESAIDLINEALRVPMPLAERKALIAALHRLGKTWPRAHTLAVVHEGLDSSSASVDVAAWSEALDGAMDGGEAKKPVAWQALESQLEYKTQVVKSRPQDATVWVELAEASLELAIDPKTTQLLATDLKTAPRFTKLMFQDARRAAQKAVELGAEGWRNNAVLALAAYYLGDTAEAHRWAEIAVPTLPKGEQGWNAMAVLGLFAEARMQAISKASRANEEWPGQWLTDVHAAYAVLARHPLGTDTQIMVHYDFLESLGAKAKAASVLQQGLQRFADSAVLHDRLRASLIAERGVPGLEVAYQEMLQQADAHPSLPWYAGYASIVAAEFYRRQSLQQKAWAAYDRSLAHFEAAIAALPECKDTADHFAALAFAGRARLAYEAQDDLASLSDLLASFERKPDAAGSLDGLNITPMDTARMLEARFRQSKQEESLLQLQAAIAQLPPKALELPAYERAAQDGRPSWRRRRQGRQGR